MSAIDREREEPCDSLSYRFDLQRRDFLRVLTAMGGGLLVVATAPAIAQESGRGARDRQADGRLASWIHIDEQGRVTVYTGKVELGQNIRTSLAQAVADELAVAIASITLVMGDTELSPFDAGTFGSRTTPFMAPVLAKAAATAREMLIDQAASRWQTDRGTLTAADGRVIAKDGRSLGYGELTKGQKLTGEVNESASAMPRARWKVRGTPVPKVNGRDIVSGRLHYTSDMTRSGMLYGRIIRPDAVGATLRNVDDSRARAMPGITVVRDGSFIGVVGPTERAVRRAATAVRAEWEPPKGQPSSQTIFDHLKKTAQTGAQPDAGRAPVTAQLTGDVVQGRAKASRLFEASYRIPYIAHVPLEPRAAVAEWTGGKLTVWTGTQRPFDVRAALAKTFMLPEDRVRVIVPDMGSGYGGKHTPEHPTEAARLARAVGRPVKIVWTRAEEFSWAYFRPAGVIDIAAGVDASGRLAFWEFDNYNSGPAGIQTPYTVPAQRVVFHPADSPFRQGSYRGLAATANHYAREMHMDQIARELGVDAVEFRLKHIEEPRLRAVLSAAAERAGWPRPSRADRALGLACGTEKMSYVATAAEVSKTPNGFGVEKIVIAFECGAVVNPDGVRNQIEGAVIQALGGALFEAIDFADGQVFNGTMAQYRVPRFKDVPPIEMIVLDRQDLPSVGAGETPMVAIAPAIGAAVRAFGKVDTALPVRLKA